MTKKNLNIRVKFQRNFGEQKNFEVTQNIFSRNINVRKTCGTFKKNGKIPTKFLRKDQKFLKTKGIIKRKYAITCNS